MNSNKKTELHIPRWEQLPDMGLYMEQVVSLVNSTLGGTFDQISYAPLTSNMVNNYVKAKIVEAPVNKKYGRLSVAMIMVVYILKMCFSTEEVSQLIASGMELGRHNILYNRFCRAIEDAMRSVFSGDIRLSDEGLPDRRLKYLMGNFALTFACKFYVHKMFLQKQNETEGV